MPNQTNQHAIEFERINIRCPECHIILCARQNIEDGWILYFRLAHKRKGIIEIYAKELALKCRDCETLHRITAEDGITESYRKEDYDKNIPGQSGGTKHLCEPIKAR